MSTENKENQNACKIVSEVLTEEFLNKCSDQQILNILSRMVGLDTENKDSDLDPDERTCEETLDTGLTDKVLGNDRATREWVMCNSWSLINKEDNDINTLETATQMSWQEVREKRSDIPQQNKEIDLTEEDLDI